MMCPILNIIITTICFNCFLSLNTFCKKDLYDALSGNSVEQIDNVISTLEKNKPTLLFNAYKGALYMKKASLITPPSQKLNIFKQGKNLLETEISKQSSNVELRFIRLIIQENVPAFLKYNNNLQADKEIILVGYKKLDEELKKIIINYSKKSKILKTSELIK